MINQKIYEIGKIGKQLAKTKGVDLSAIQKKFLTFGSVTYVDNSPIKELSVLISSNSVLVDDISSFNGNNGSYNFFYLGFQNIDPKKTISEGLFIGTPERTIIVIRGTYNYPNYIQVKDTKATHALGGLNQMKSFSHHPMDGRNDGILGYFVVKDIPKIKVALEKLI